MGLQANIGSFYLTVYKDSYLDVENISSMPNSKTTQLKQVDPITLVSNLLLYFIGTTTDIFTSYASYENEILTDLNRPVHFLYSSAFFTA